MPHPRGPAGTTTACYIFDIEIKRHMEHNNKFGWLVHLGPLWPQRTYYDKIEPYDTIIYDIESKVVWTRRDRLPVLDRIPLRGWNEENGW